MNQKSAGVLYDRCRCFHEGTVTRTEQQRHAVVVDQTPIVFRGPLRHAAIVVCQKAHTLSKQPASFVDLLKPEIVSPFVNDPRALSVSAGFGETETDRYFVR